MSIPQPLITIYNDLAPFLEIVEKRVGETLARYSREHLLPFISRKKSIDSVAEKIETGRYRSFGEIDDLVACTLVVPTLQDEKAAVDFCKQAFDIFNVKGRTSINKWPETFRFDATRLYGRLLRAPGSDIGGETPVYDIIFEIQIRTAFEHAWIVGTHPLTYKTDNIDWKRFRLSAQIKAIVEQLDLAVHQFEMLASGVIESPWPEIEQKRKIVYLIAALVRDCVIPPEANPQDMSRFADNFFSLVHASKKKVDVNVALTELEQGLRTFSAETFPRSASLLQVSMALLFKMGVISGPLRKYSCHVTEELAQLFPGVDALSPIFIYRE